LNAVNCLNTSELNAVNCLNPTEMHAVCKFLYEHIQYPRFQSTV
jgi:hypothetical protein